ncbi:MAG: T9SS type A sorting domain-containing protein [Saprospiraceae bacterium]|nr:T9SS type A sorting domain-containing protein [Saprospiraceae bacterium]
MYTTNSSICDSAGNLLFYTNGCVIAGADDEILENGEGINPGNAHNLWCEQYNEGYSGGPAASVILPMPDSSGVFYLFHKRFTLFYNPISVNIDKLFYTVVDMNQNGGKGKVLEKNVELMSDTLARGEIAAVKHANGKDWWLVTPRRNSNQFYIFRFTSQGIVDTFQQTIGILPDPDGEGFGQMVFSPDGSKLYRTYRYNPVMVYSFDREAGVFTQFDTISFDYGNQLVGEIGCAISPNNQYLYLSCRQFLYQLDLWAPDISASQVTVAQWDGFTDPFPTMFWQCQLGPDCKIYVRAGGDTRFYHVIHNPDEPGLACNVQQRGLPLPTRSGSSMPSFPNYRLGPLDNPGVPCTATVSAPPPPATEKNTVQVWPNPATDEFTLSYSLPQARGESRLILTDLYGRVVHETRLQGASGRVAVRTDGWAAGVYFFSIASNEVGLSSGKIIVQR